MKKFLLLMLLSAMSFTAFSAEKTPKNEIKITNATARTKKIKKFKKDFQVVHVTLDYYCESTGATYWFHADFALAAYNGSISARQQAVDEYVSQLYQIADFLDEGCPQYIF